MFNKKGPLGLFCFCYNSSDLLFDLNIIVVEKTISFLMQVYIKWTIYDNTIVDPIIVMPANNSESKSILLKNYTTIFAACQ